MRRAFLWGGVALAIGMGSLPVITLAKVADNNAAKSSAHILQYAISPAGTWLAEVAVGGSVVGPAEHVEIVSLRSAARVHRAIFVAKNVTSIRWLTNSRILIASSLANSTESALIEESVRTGSRQQLIRSRHALRIVGVDRQAHRVAYTYSTHWRWNGRHSVKVNADMSTIGLIEPVWARWPRTHLGEIQIVGTRHVRAVKVPLRVSVFESSPHVAWRKGNLIVVKTSVRTVRGRIYEASSGRRLERAVPLYRLLGIAVSHSGTLAVNSSHYWKVGGKAICACNGPENIYILGKHGKAEKLQAMNKRYFLEAITGVWWGSHGRLFAQVEGTRRPGGPLRWWVDEVNWRNDTLMRRFTWANGDLGDWGNRCEFDARRTIAICVAQTLSDPPVLVSVNLRTGKFKRLVRMNPTQVRLRFKFRQVRIRNRFGYISTAFLAVPPTAKNAPVPLAVMAYGFSEAYSRYAQWITSYPVAKFVHAGIAVLLVNWANIPGIRSDSFGQEKRILQSAVSTFANAIPAVRTAGIRVSRAIVMGWSFGGLFAAHAIQSLHCYVAAQVGDPAYWNATEYGIGGAWARYMAKWAFGGPPIARYMNHYVFVDPAGNGRAAHGPILLEFVSRNPDAGQYLQEWRAVGTQVEAFSYRYSVHSLTVPAEANISRQRNLYWAELNLFGPSAVPRAQLRSVGLTVPTKGWWTLSSTG